MHYRYLQLAFSTFFEFIYVKIMRDRSLVRSLDIILLAGGICGCVGFLGRLDLHRCCRYSGVTFIFEWVQST